MAPAPDNASSLRAEGGRRWRRIAATAFLLLGCSFASAFIKEVADRTRLIAPPPTPIVYDRQGVFLTQIGDEISDANSGQRIEYGYWPLARLSDRVTRATLALEDRRFWDHPGVDLAAVLRAALNNMRGKKRSGASTLAMQVARMQHPAPRSLMAKAYEAATAVALTLRFGHEAILAQYLRLIPYGNGSHGIAHASRFYFDKPVDDLSWAEIALLSAIPQSPTLMNPLRPDGLARAIRRGQGMLNELRRKGVIGAAELALARRQLASLRPQAPRRPDALHVVLRYEALAAEGQLPIPSPFDPRVRASIDLDIQKQASNLARRYLNGWRDAGAQQVAVMVVERGSEAVLADIGSNDYRDQHAGAIDFSRSPRSPGSTLKPFIYALALDRGIIRPSDVLADLPEGSSLINNADGHFLGPMLPRQALANSRNVPATNLLRATGLDTTFDFLRRLGLHNFKVPADSFGLSMAIGSLPTTLERLVRAYGSIAEDGRLADLQWVDGQQRREPKRVMSTDAARLITSFLSDPMARLPSFPRYGPTEYPFPVALKTGTSQGYRDAWTVAWSRKYLVGVWIGRGDDGTMTQLSGAGSAGRLVHALLVQLHGARRGDLDDTAFPPPEGRVPVELCVFGGRRSNGSCGQTLTEWLRPDEIPPVDDTPPLAARDARVALTVPAAHRAWAAAAGYLVVDTESGRESARLSIVAPENNSRIWLNPDAPTTISRLALKAVVEPKVPQIIWYVDGEPYAVADADTTIYWPITKGAHRFQARLPLQPGGSNMIHVVVE
jgi:penicillin-binding protein 1C